MEGFSHPPWPAPSVADCPPPTLPWRPVGLMSPAYHVEQIWEWEGGGMQLMVTCRWIPTFVLHTLDNPPPPRLSTHHHANVLFPHPFCVCQRFRDSSSPRATQATNKPDGCTSPWRYFTPRVSPNGDGDHTHTPAGPHSGRPGRPAVLPRSACLQGGGEGGTGPASVQHWGPLPWSSKGLQPFGVGSETWPLPWTHSPLPTCHR